MSSNKTEEIFTRAKISEVTVYFSGESSEDMKIRNVFHDTKFD
jgi:hypothetical protein